MTAITYNQKKSTFPKILLLLVILSVAAVVVMLSADHGIKAHGDQLSWAIRTACENNPIWQGKRSNGRIATIGKYWKNGADHFGVCYHDHFPDDYVTSYPRKGTLDEIINWLKGEGGFNVE